MIQNLSKLFDTFYTCTLKFKCVIFIKIDIKIPCLLFYQIRTQLFTTLASANLSAKDTSSLEQISSAVLALTKFSDELEPDSQVRFYDYVTSFAIKYQLCARALCDHYGIFMI